MRDYKGRMFRCFKLQLLRKRSSILQHVVAHFKLHTHVQTLKNCRMKASVFLNYFDYFSKCHKSMYTAAFIYFKIYFLAKSALLHS